MLQTIISSSKCKSADFVIKLSRGLEFPETENIITAPPVHPTLYVEVIGAS
jgi:hypothetical protein